MNRTATEPPYSAQAFRDRARPVLHDDPSIVDPHREFGEDTADARFRFSGPIDVAKEAAVLVPVVDRGSEATILLTQRTDHLPSHAGQISFPGGKIDPDDRTPLAAALREAEEEIGLTEPFVEPIGSLPPYLSNTGYLINPVVAVVRPGFQLVRNEGEVADIFEVPLRFLMSARNHQRNHVLLGGRQRLVFAMPYEDRYIWGVTAGILRLLYETVYA